MKDYICKFEERGLIIEETLSLNEENFEQHYRDMLKEFNETEKERHGNEAKQRKFVSVELKKQQETN